MAGKKVAPWDTRFCYALAMDKTVGSKNTLSICEEYGVIPAAHMQWETMPAFRRQVDEFYEEIIENGLSFRTKAKLQAEDMLAISHRMVVNPDTPAAVRADLIKWTAKMADLEPKQPLKSATGEQFDLDEAKRMLQNMDMVELETRVTRIVASKEKQERVINE